MDLKFVSSLSSQHSCLLTFLQTVVDSYRSLCQNPSRIRRCLVNSLQHFYRFNKCVVEDYTSDPDASALALKTLHECYIEQRLGWQSVWIILLGFEHEIYETYEIGLLYKYVARNVALYEREQMRVLTRLGSLTRLSKKSRSITSRC